MDLEKLFEKFKDRGVAIRWVNDTVALAVFRTPAIGKLYDLIPSGNNLWSIIFESRVQ